MRIRLSVVGIRAVFLIPETDGYGLITFCGDEADLFVKSLLFAEQRNDLPIKNIGKLGRAKRIGLKFQRDVARMQRKEDRTGRQVIPLRLAASPSGEFPAALPQCSEVRLA